MYVTTTATVGGSQSGTMVIKTVLPEWVEVSFTLENSCVPVALVGRTPGTAYVIMEIAQGTNVYSTGITVVDSPAFRFGPTWAQNFWGPLGWNVD
jgi:hypothetical protein